MAGEKCAVVKPPRQQHIILVEVDTGKVRSGGGVVNVPAAMHACVAGL